jgi:hypothetical protein
MKSDGTFSAKASSLPIKLHLHLILYMLKFLIDRLRETKKHQNTRTNQQNDKDFQNSTSKYSYQSAK